MSIDAIAPLSTASLSPSSVSQATTPAADFNALVSSGLGKVDQGLKVADQQFLELAAGHDVAPHEVMISMEEARMHLALLVEVRNRVVDGYQELSRMQL
ncbi:MAG TPA: flagellar hook-basal body complex protein FliE [Rhodanobacter sp.]